MAKVAKERLPRGRDLFKDVTAQGEAVNVADSLSILPERPWTFAEYGRDWALDSFAVTHNAVRAELGDLYGIVVSMVKRKDTVTLEDIENFFVWWPPFASFLEDALFIDHQLVLGPWETRIALAGPVSSIKREMMMTEVSEKVEHISKLVSTFRQEDPKSILTSLIDFCDVTVPKINAMFETAETETTTFMLKQPQHEYPKQKFFDDIANYALKVEDPYLFVILWLRGFQSLEQRQHFKELFLKSKKKRKLFFKKKKWYEGYEIADKNLKQTHFAAVREFWRAWRLSDNFLNIDPNSIKLPLPKKVPLLELTQDFGLDEGVEGYDEEEDGPEGEDTEYEALREEVVEAVDFN